MAVEKPETSLWADLPSPLVELILERLPFTDYLRFPSVCLWWRDVQQDHHLRRAASPCYQRQMPWLMFFDHQCRQKRVFYNPSERRYYRISFPTNKSFPDVSNHGWFYSGSEVINLFTGSRIPIPCPLETNNHEAFEDVSYVPTDPYCLLLSYFTATPGDLSYYFYRFKDKAWTRLEHPSHINDICEGKFYGLLLDNKILTQVVALPCMDMAMDMDEDVIILDEIFWVECDGHILLTQILRTLPDLDKYKIQILKADLSRNAWVRLESLGDNMLFLSRSNSLSLSAADAGGRGNCVYFWDKKDNLWDKEDEGMLIEYDYETHHAIHRRIPYPVENSWNFDRTFLGWTVPSLC